MSDPIFPGFAKPTTDFGAVQNDMRTTPLYIEVDLSTARTIAAGSALTFNVNGNSLFIDQDPNSGWAQIVYQDDARSGYTYVTAYPGFGAKVGFTRLIIQNDAQPGKILRVIYGVDMDLFPSLGAGIFATINVQSGEFQRTLDGIAYAGACITGAVVGGYAAAQVSNESTDKNIVISQVYISGTPAQEVQLGFGVGALASPVGWLGNKLAGAADSAAARLRRGAPGSPPTVTTVLEYINLANNAAERYVIQEPYVIPPGYALNVYSVSTGTTLWVTFNGYETDA